METRTDAQPIPPLPAAWDASLAALNLPSPWLAIQQPGGCQPACPWRGGSLAVAPFLSQPRG